MKRLFRNVAFFFYGVLVSVVIATMINAAHAEMICFDTDLEVGVQAYYDPTLYVAYWEPAECNLFKGPTLWSQGPSGPTVGPCHTPDSYWPIILEIVECPEAGGGEGEGAYYFPITPDDASLLTDAFMYGFFLVGACAIAGIAVGAIFRLIKG